ncbi:hypothetical protein [Kitasatospora sp. NBC_01302]|uniref:hypothetical protein n=1 Tax=Kitasatospora sp. NBC_01302 TaxID=2903575 RepID=UPI002E10DD9A|nr:hypothetical protein OG294_06585 [Kitasatospora sp. NBC_01302]
MLEFTDDQDVLCVRVEGPADTTTAVDAVDFEVVGHDGSIRSNHHLRAVQLPISLVHLAPVAQALDGHGPLADAAAAGLEVFASAPLHGGEIPGMVTPELSELINPGWAPAEVALAVVASAPGVKRVLLSTRNPEHWKQAAEAVGRPPLSRDVLRRVVDVLGT